MACEDIARSGRFGRAIPWDGPLFRSPRSADPTGKSLRQSCGTQAILQKRQLGRREGRRIYLLVQDAEGVMDEVTDSLGLPRINHELVLFGGHDGAWEKVKSWPVPPELDGFLCRCPGRK
jgi:hypothetical protein